MTIKTMQHWNGNQMCAIDIETTGLDSQFNEIVQMAILPLDVHLEPRKDVMPLDIYIIPDHPERIDRKSTKVHGARLGHIMKHGFDKVAAIDLIEDWILKLNLPLNKGGINPCKILPLGHNYCFDRAFMIALFGLDFYESYFHYLYRDTMQHVLFLNDHAAQHANPIPFPSSSLVAVANILKIKFPNAHNAIFDCVATAQIYKKLVSLGLL